MSLRERLVVAGLLVVTSCSGSTPVPATAPTTSAVTTTAAETTTSAAPATTTTTVAVDRLAEIEAIFQDLEQRRLTALYEGDREAFAALFANEEYLARSLDVFDLAEFTSAPSAVEPGLTAILFESPTCLALEAEVDYSDFVAGAEPAMGTYVLERRTGSWGYSFVGEGWLCEGPHPLEP